ncbi:serine kinase [Qipengyuania profunda]|jgi:HPr kinase/phosphorylase|uniref:HPr kinase/phosphorylase n=1 Tax=Qipengyuania profunda TaxID=3113984 RepID=UPI002A18AB0C|nr:serine kinase [Qipengyuania sp. HL-TH1]WPL56485.1 serine kinase [Qipengyuania sp. HL-TH5]
MAVLANITAVGVAGRVLLIEGQPGSGKSALALALIDRGAILVGDDAVSVVRIRDTLLAAPPPNTCGLIEIHNVGIAELPVTEGPVALLLTLDPAAPRFPMDIPVRDIEGVPIPMLPFAPGDAVQALRAEYALELHGLPLPKGDEKA